MPKHAAAALPRLAGMRELYAVAAALAVLLAAMLDGRQPRGRRRRPRNSTAPEPAYAAAHRRRPSPGPPTGALTGLGAHQ